MQTKLVAQLRSELASHETSWSVGCFGAIAEFHWDEGESVKALEPLGMASERGSVRILDLEPLESGSAQGLAWEGPGGHGASWTQGFALHMDEQTARMSVRDQLTLLDEDEEGQRFDLGLAAPNVDACVLIKDEELRAQLESHCGKSIWDPENPAMQLMKEASPTRCFTSKVAEVRVRQHIGSSKKHIPTPMGPHTHVIRGLLKNVHAQDQSLPIPEGRHMVLGMYPAHPTQDDHGETRAFSQPSYEHFQSLLGTFGSQEFLQTKQRLLKQARSGEASRPNGFDRKVARVLLPQLGHLGIDTGSVAQLSKDWDLEHIYDAVQSQAVQSDSAS